MILQRRDGRDCSPDSLDHQADDVAAQEDQGVRARLPAANLLPVDDDDAAEAQVDGGGEEDGADGETDQIHEEPAAQEGVLVEKQPADVARGLHAEAGEHAEADGGGAELDAEPDLGEGEDVDEEQEEEVAGEGGHVFDEAPDVDVAGGEVADEAGDVARGDFAHEERERHVEGLRPFLLDFLSALWTQDERGSCVTERKKSKRRSATVAALGWNPSSHCWHGEGKGAWIVFKAWVLPPTPRSSVRGIYCIQCLY